MSHNPISVAFVDDNALARQALTNRLNIYSFVSLQGEAEDEVAALSLVQRVKPDIFIVGLKRSGHKGLELCRQITRLSPNTGVILLTLKNEVEPEQVFAAGARGFLLKYDLLSDLEQALQVVARGETFLSSRLEPVSRNSGAAPNLLSAVEAMPDKDQRFLRQLLCGHTVRASAQAVGISPARGAVVRQRILDTLGVRSLEPLIRATRE